MDDAVDISARSESIGYRDVIHHLTPDNPKLKYCVLVSCRGVGGGPDGSFSEWKVEHPVDPDITDCVKLRENDFYVLEQNGVPTQIGIDVLGYSIGLDVRYQTDHPHILVLEPGYLEVYEGVTRNEVQLRSIGKMLMGWGAQYTDTELALTNHGFEKPSHEF